MRVALCQIDTTVGDFEGNGSLIREASQQAEDAGAQLAVFPELAICGYPPRDLLELPAFINANRVALERLAAALPAALHVLVGFVDRAPNRSERPLCNAAALLHAGAVAQVFHKRLLPTYDVFEEARHFQPGRLPLTFEAHGQRVGVTICEDAWNDEPHDGAHEDPHNPLGGLERRAYADNPLADAVAEGAQVLVNLAASPFTLGKRHARPQMLARSAKRHRMPLVFVNLVGGNDDIIFDGASAVFGPDGATWGRAPSFEHAVRIVDLQPPAPNPSDDVLASNEAAVLDALVLGTRDYARKCGFTKALVGLSGGVDSALVACIAASALGPEHVLAVAMPTRYSSAGSRRDAHALATALGIELRVIDIDPLFQRFLDTLQSEVDTVGAAGPKDTTWENVQARIRGVTLMALSNRGGHLLLTTGNKSEIAVGYCTLYGDMAGGLAVISDVPKTAVYRVAREVNRRAKTPPIPESVFTKVPSAELRPNQSDQDSLPPYEQLDPVLEALVEDGRSVEDIVAAGFERQMVESIAAMVRGTEYKRRQMPPGLIVTRKAFGPGRRVPIAQRFRR